jgi:hypothetical protein
MNRLFCATEKAPHLRYLCSGERQVLNNQLIIPITTGRKSDGVVHRKLRLGGSLNYYYRDAV